MTHPFYTEQQLSVKAQSELKTIYTQIGCNVDVADKRRKHAWMEAIVIHQSSQIQAIAQAELNAYIEQQVAEITQEEHDSLRVAEVEFVCLDGFYNYEAIVNNKVIAAITYNTDDFETQRWVVMVGDKEVHRANTQQKCEGYIRWHHKNGTLPQVSQSVVEPVITNNATMAEISAAADEFGLELLDDGIYNGDVKLGEVGCNNGSWWVVRSASLHQQKIPCDSVKEAVWILSNFVPTSSNNTDVLLDKPFDELTQEEWKFLKCIDTSALDEIFGMSTVKSFCPDVVTAPLDEVFAAV